MTHWAYAFTAVAFEVIGAFLLCHGHDCTGGLNIGAGLALALGTPTPRPGK